jgi:hypothetical protein
VGSSQVRLGAGGVWCADVTWWHQCGVISGEVGGRWRAAVTWWRWHGVVGVRSSHVSSSFQGNHNLRNECNKLVNLRKKKRMKKKLTVGPNDAIASFGPLWLLTRCPCSPFPHREQLLTAVVGSVMVV